MPAVAGSGLECTDVVRHAGASGTRWLLAASLAARFRRSTPPAATQQVSPSSSGGWRSAPPCVWVAGGRLALYCARGPRPAVPQRLARCVDRRRWRGAADGCSLTALLGGRPAAASHDSSTRRAGAERILRSRRRRAVVVARSATSTPATARTSSWPTSSACPSAQRVDVRLTSDNVIHSFWIPSISRQGGHDSRPHDAPLARADAHRRLSRRVRRVLRHLARADGIRRWSCIEHGGVRTLDRRAARGRRESRRARRASGPRAVRRQRLRELPRRSRHRRGRRRSVPI